MRKYFDYIDRDGSGYITTAKLQHLMTPTLQGFSDSRANRIMDAYDADSDGVITLCVFEAMLSDLGFEIQDDAIEDEVMRDAHARDVEGCPDQISQLADECVGLSDSRVLKILEPLVQQHPDRKVQLADLKSMVEMWTQEARCRGQVIRRVNHIALLVSDVGRSAAFYANVLGLRQIKRPDFDRYGAWFSLGNIELHLIKGDPLVHSGENLVVGHISLEVSDIDRVPKILEATGWPFEQNVTVPKGRISQGSGTNSSMDGHDVKQFFLRDPDGYYLEICNCDVLAEYTHSTGPKSEEMIGLLSISLGIAELADRLEAEFQMVGPSLKNLEVTEVAQRLVCGLRPCFCRGKPGDFEALPGASRHLRRRLPE